MLKSVLFAHDRLKHDELNLLNVTHSGNWLILNLPYKLVFQKRLGFYFLRIYNEDLLNLEHDRAKLSVAIERKSD